MGQKVNPIGFRLGVIRSWDSLWYADHKAYSEYLHQDLKIREFIFKEFAKAGVSRVKIERLAKKIRVMAFVARPGIILGRKGEEAQKVQKFVEKLTTLESSINVMEVKRADINAVLVAQNIAHQIGRRVSHKKAMKRAADSAMKMGACGIKVCISGRLGGAEIARVEWQREGRVPLHTLRADIGFGYEIAHTTYGTIGVKVWVYNGDRGEIVY
jgi:small subunit ribosomal protein S3